MTDDNELNGNKPQDNFMEHDSEPAYGIKGLAEEATIGARGTDKVVSDEPTRTNRAANAVEKGASAVIDHSKHYSDMYDKPLINSQGEEYFKPSPESVMAIKIPALGAEVVKKAAQVVAKHTQGGLRPKTSK